MEHCDCGEVLGRDCYGNERCPVCDPPCPCCDDGGWCGNDDWCDNDDEELAADF